MLKKEALKQHHERLMNVEFPWNAENLSFEAVSGPPIKVTHTMVEKAINKMKVSLWTFWNCCRDAQSFRTKWCQPACQNSQLYDQK